MNRQFINMAFSVGVVVIVGLACSQLPSLPLQQSEQSPQTQQPPTPAAATPAQAVQSPTPDPTNEKLLEKLAELEKKIDEQQKLAKATPPPVIRSATTAWVNSPGDGFLALRSNPSSEVGYRILEIPHGAEVRVLNCQSKTTRIGGRNGRWCNVRYRGTTGWAFDGWLVY